MFQRSLIGGLGLSLILVLPVPANEPGEPDFEKPSDRVVYAIGLSLAKTLESFELSERELELVQAGLTDGANDQAAIPLRTWGHRVEGFRRQRIEEATAREKEAAVKIVAAAAAEKGAVQTRSKLVYREVLAGTGPSPTAKDRVKVHYKGTRRDGSVFDTTRAGRGKPRTFGLNGVIKCWTEGLQKMKVGGKAVLVCPPEIAYGDKGKPGTIKPGAVLTFEIELLDVLPPKKS